MRAENVRAVDFLAVRVEVAERVDVPLTFFHHEPDRAVPVDQFSVRLDFLEGHFDCGGAARRGDSTDAVQGQCPGFPQTSQIFLE